MQTRQLEHGGIVDQFERRFSADGVKHHKPSREAYAYVEREVGLRPSQHCLIASHTWDTLGAVAAGWEAAFIKRVGNDLLAVGGITTLRGIAALLSEREIPAPRGGSKWSAAQVQRVLAHKN